MMANLWTWHSIVVTTSNIDGTSLVLNNKLWWSSGQFWPIDQMVNFDQLIKWSILINWSNGQFWSIDQMIMMMLWSLVSDHYYHHHHNDNDYNDDNAYNEHNDDDDNTVIPWSAIHLLATPASPPWQPSIGPQEIKTFRLSNKIIKIIFV